MAVKRCSLCKERKEIDAFPRDCTQPSGYKTQCKDCRNAAQRSRRSGTEPPPCSLESDPDALAGAIPFGTPLQRASAEALLSAGSVEAAAESLGLTPRQLRAQLSELERRAAQRGWSPASDMTKPVAEGYHVKGVSTLYGADGEVRGQWVKSQRDPEHRIAALLDAVQTIAEPFRGAADPAKQPNVTDDDLLAVYPMGDAHIGLYSWAHETGEPFDLQIAESTLVGAVDHLVDLAPPAKRALIINLGDYLHGDNSSNRTARGGHALDVDTRWAKVLGVGIRAMRRCIDRALEKHDEVTVICEIGNHDDHSAIVLAICLEQYYEREPRVTIDTSPAKFHYYRFGDCLIGVTHGDTVKADKLGAIMACDRAKDWGETQHRYIYCGHIHHDSLREYPGVIVESFRTLAARDAWHSAHGYRSGRDMKCDVLHRTDGRIARHIVGVHRLLTRAAV